MKHKMKLCVTILMFLGGAKISVFSVYIIRLQKGHDNIWVTFAWRYKKKCPWPYLRTQSNMVSRACAPFRSTWNRLNMNIAQGIPWQNDQLSYMYGIGLLWTVWTVWMMAAWTVWLFLWPLGLSLSPPSL